MANATTVSGVRSSSRKKTSSSLQEEAMHEALHTLRKSRAGYVSAMSNACSQIDALLDDYANLLKLSPFMQLWIKRGKISPKMLHDIEASSTKIASKFTRLIRNTLLKKRENFSTT